MRFLEIKQYKRPALLVNLDALVYVTAAPGPSVYLHLSNGDSLCLTLLSGRAQDAYDAIVGAINAEVTHATVTVVSLTRYQHDPAVNEVS